MEPIRTLASGRRTAAIFLTALALTTPALAAQRQSVPVERSETTKVAVPVPSLPPDQDASDTRERFEEVIKRLPPTVGRVLRLDPSLMGNETYLAPYPTLSAFIKQHPEIRSAPGYFLEHTASYDFWAVPETRESAGVRLWRDIMAGIAVGAVILTITSVLIWIIRTFLEYRRWNRTSKIHTEVNNKLLDRFTTNEELLAYIQTPAGRKFIESAPLALDSPSRPVGAPYNRILWSVQVGVVLAAGGLGLFYVSSRVLDEVAQPLFAVGVLALSFGVGFVVSAAASYLLSRRLGLLDAEGRS